MQRDKGEDERFQILNEIIEDAQSLWVVRIVHVGKGTNLCGLGSITLVGQLTFRPGSRTSNEI